MKRLLRIIIIFFSSRFGDNINGKFIGFLDFCRQVICDNKNCFIGQIHQRMNVENIIPKKPVITKYRIHEIQETDKIKVRILYPSGDSWNNIHTLYESFVSDENYQTIVVVENYPRFLSIMEMVKCKYITLDDYNVKIDRPDIFIATYYSGADLIISFPGCRKYIKTLFAAIPNAVMNEKNRNIHWKYISSAYQNLDPDFYLVDRLMYNGLKGYVEDKKLIEMGNPQFDEIFREVGKNHPTPENWKKLRGKKTILWATDHGINESFPTNGFTVDLYLGEIFNYFNEHQEMGLIFRPHPQLIKEMLIKGAFWSETDIMKLKKFCIDSPNIVWDDTYDFCCAYDNCDAILVDLNCSIICSALTTGKPICRLKREDIEEWMIAPEITECYYFAKGFDECVAYFNMVSNGIDTKVKERSECFKKAILHFDGNNGERMKKFITQQYNCSGVSYRA